MPVKTVFVREHDLETWKRLGEEKKLAARVSFALSLTDEEIEHVEKLRLERKMSIQLPAESK